MLKILGKTFYYVEEYLDWLTEGRAGEPVEPFSDLESLVEGGKAVWERDAITNSPLETLDVLIVNNNFRPEAIPHLIGSYEVLVMNKSNQSRVRVSISTYLKAIGLPAPQQYRTHSEMTRFDWAFLAATSVHGIECKPQA